MNIKEVNRDINLLFSNIIMEADYYGLCENSSPRFLLVEGGTDKSFAEKIDTNVKCIIAAKAYGNNVSNYKNTIIKVVCALSNYPAEFFKVPKMLANCQLWGMVDLDFDDPNVAYSFEKKMFVTDTHDLETLLLSTDNELLNKLDGCSISKDDIKTAYYMSYQLGMVKKTLYEVADKDFDISMISSDGKYDVDYSVLFEDKKINIKKVVDYINEKAEKPVSSEKTKKFVDESVKLLKKKVTREGTWVVSFEEFDITTTKDFWQIVNGHDIRALLKYINMDVARVFKKQSTYGLDRMFEGKLVEKYDYSNIKITTMYKKMCDENVVNGNPV